MTLKLKIGFSILIVLFLGLLAGAFCFYRALNLPNSNAQGYAIVDVQAGTVQNVGEDLRSKGILKAPLIFSLYARLANKQIYAGYYKLPKNLSPKETFLALTNEDYRVYRVTVPEGYRAEQIAQKLADASLADYEKFLSTSKSKEGRLFPDTYFFSKNMEPKDIVKAMNDNFNERTKDLGLTTNDIILASIVERETAGDDRGIIAGIYKNRLKINMKLDADPTVQYAKDSNSIKGLGTDEILAYKFWRSITSKDYYNTISAYNTYINTSLPPAPICNPVLASLAAALNPDKHDYIYFFHVDGQIYPSKTLEEHNQKKEKYLYQ